MVNYGLAILLIHVVSSLINRPAIFVRHLKLKCQTQDGGGAITKKILTPGTGLNVDVGDILEVEYKAYIKGSNTPFAKGKQNNFVVKDGSMIRCWDMAVATMKVNEYAMFDCKADYAYGKNGIVNVIPPNADILLEIKVLAFLGNKLRPERSNWNTPETAVQAAKGENKEKKSDMFDGSVLDIYKRRLATASFGFAGSGFFTSQSGEKAPWYLNPNLTFPAMIAIVSAAFVTVFLNGAVREKGVVGNLDVSSISDSSTNKLIS